MQSINSGVTSIVLPYGRAVVKRTAGLAVPRLLLNATVSNLNKSKNEISRKRESIKEKRNSHK